MLSLKPTITEAVDDKYILWFSVSNKYIVINSLQNELITFFLSSDKIESFSLKLREHHDFSEDQILSFYNDVKALLHECNISAKLDIKESEDFDSGNRTLHTVYKLGDFTFDIYFNSEKLKSIIHPQLSHLECASTTNSIDFTFDIYSSNNHLYLFKNKNFIGKYVPSNYHLLQGKFAMELLCSLNNNEEKDWMGTFHASTVSKNDSSVMLIGDSGNGKSTFTALLTANGFDLVADDITPILSKTNKIHCYPAGISIKSGAFETLNKLIPGFKDLPQYYINPYKGYVKYIPSNNSKFITKSFDCDTLVLVEYNPETEAKLDSIELSEALKILIPESWIEPSQENAISFLKWLQQLKCYKLTYGNNHSGISIFSELF